MANQDLTVFQKLTQIFGFQNRGQQAPPSFNFSREELLRTDDPVEFEKTKLRVTTAGVMTKGLSKAAGRDFLSDVGGTLNRHVAEYAGLKSPKSPY